ERLRKAAGNNRHGHRAMCTGSGEASRAGSGPLWIWQLGGFAADPPTGSGSTSQLIMRTYPDARLRADARGRDGGVRQELEAGAKGVDRPAGGSIQNVSGLSQGLAGHFGGGSQTEAYGRNHRLRRGFPWL